MAIKRLGKSGFQEQQPQIQSEQEIGFAPKAAFALGRGAEAPGQLFNLLMGLIGEPQTFQPTTEEIRQRLGYTQEQLQPEGKLQTGALRFLEALPTAATGGIGMNLFPTALGAAAVPVAQTLGLGQTGQDIAQLATEFSTRMAGKAIPTIASKARLPSFGGLPQIAQEAERAAEQATYTGVPAGRALDFFKEPMESARKVSSLIQDTSHPTRRIINQIEGVISNAMHGDGKMNYVEGLLARQLLDDIKINPEATPTALDVLKKYRSSLNDFLKKYNPTNPDFAKYLTKRDLTYEIIGMQNKVTDYLNNLGNIGKLGATLFKAAPLIDRANRLAVLAKNDPKIFLEYMQKAVEGAIRDNPRMTFQALESASKLMDKREPMLQQKLNIKRLGKKK